jgi:Tfp pilus assembly PilM family ATPase
MLHFLARKPALGIDLTSSAARMAAVSGRENNLSVRFVKTVKLPAGLLTESYTTQNLNEPDRFVDALREGLSGAPELHLQRAALGLPDGVFRVQTLEFDELPGKAADRERLVRWRLEKSAFDVSDTILRYQVIKRQDKGVSVLACAAKKSVIAQYEAALVALGLEPWSVAPSSFHVLNFYEPYLSRRSPVFALAHVLEDRFTTLISEKGGAGFYRYKELKQGNAEELTAGLIREIDDSLHFYTHRDRSQQTEIGRLYLTGEAARLPGLAAGLKAATSLEVEVLTPAVVLPSAREAGPETAAALGAGRGL